MMAVEGQRTKEVNRHKRLKVPKINSKEQMLIKGIKNVSLAFFPLK